MAFLCPDPSGGVQLLEWFPKRGEFCEEPAKSLRGEKIVTVSANPGNNQNSQSSQGTQGKSSRGHLKKVVCRLVIKTTSVKYYRLHACRLSLGWFLRLIWPFDVQMVYLFFRFVKFSFFFFYNIFLYILGRKHLSFQDSRKPKEFSAHAHLFDKGMMYLARVGDGHHRSPWSFVVNTMKNSNVNININSNINVNITLNNIT